MFKHFKIGVRLTLCFSLLGVLLLALAAIALMRMSETAQTVADEKLIRTTQLAQLYRLREALAQTGIAARNAYIYDNDTDALRELDVLDQQRAIFLDSLQRLEPVLAGRPDFDKANTGLVSMAAELARVRQLRMQGDIKAYGAFLVNECTPLRRRIVGELDLVIGNIEARMNDASANVDQVLAQSRSVVIAIAVAALLIGAFLAYRVTVSITVPLKEAADFAEAVAVGDLTRAVSASSKDEIGMLMGSLGNMRAGLIDIVNGVRAGTDAITISTGEIATGNQDLSSRTEAQAASLQQTASAMHMLNDTVGRNADDARSAREVATDAARIAVKGGVIVDDVVATMGAISQASDRIVDIIAVIDGIAFQTNILALNAAVEAARAGEQGRGFAVVASEVRQLAQRCTNAAKEVKTLVHSSVAKIGDGAALVDQSGATMKELLASVHSVNVLIERIAGASDQQARSVHEINTAVDHVDGLTQQNSALVEQAAAAAASMHEQASALARQVMVFRIG